MYFAAKQMTCNKVSGAVLLSLFLYKLMREKSEKHLEIMSIFSRNSVIQLAGDKLCEKQQLWIQGSLIKIPPSRLYSGEEIFIYTW